MDPAEKSRASIGRRLAQRLLSSACQSLLGRKVQTNCRLRTGTFKLLQCRRRALLLLMSAPCFEHLLLRTTISSCGFGVGPKHSHCACLPLHSKQPPRSLRRVWNTSLYCIYSTTCQEGSFGEWHIYNLLCQQRRYQRKFEKDSVGKIQSLRRAHWAFQPTEFIFRILVLCEEAAARRREFTNLIIICLRPVSEEIKSISNRSSLPFVLNPLLPIS